MVVKVSPAAHHSIYKITLQTPGVSVYMRIITSSNAIATTKYFEGFENQHNLHQV